MTLTPIHGGRLAEVKYSLLLYNFIQKLNVHKAFFIIFKIHGPCVWGQGPKAGLIRSFRKVNYIFVTIRISSLLPQQWEINLMHNYEVNEALYLNFKSIGP